MKLILNKEEEEILKYIEKYKLRYPIFYKYISNFFKSIIIFPIIIWIVYLIGKCFPLIPWTFSAGELLSYFGALVSAAATISAVVLTILYTSSQNKKQLQRQIEKENDEKKYIELYEMAKNILLLLSCDEVIQEYYSLEKGENYKKVTNKFRGKLREASKIQWLNYKLSENDETLNKIEKKYFKYAYNELLYLEKLYNPQKTKTIGKFIKKLSIYSYRNQYKHMKRTSDFISYIRKKYYDKWNI